MVLPTRAWSDGILTGLTWLEKEKSPPTIVTFGPETPAGWANAARKRGTSFQGDPPGALKFYVLARTSRKKLRKKLLPTGKS
jgi:hypothetical protein